MTPPAPAPVKCPHDVPKRQMAVGVDAMCPFCLALAVAALRAENAAKTAIITEMVEVFGGDSQFMEDVYGKQCPDSEAGCATCRAYAVIEKARAALAGKKEAPP